MEVDAQPLEILYACIVDGEEVAYIWAPTLQEASRRAKSYYGHEGGICPAEGADGERICR